ncbi:MAG: hypothetical protein M1831_005505 [Alyxoria varia]|nr:MAG: hypothetical protein M1831_005505 [Alyxoria varia]
MQQLSFGTSKATLGAKLDIAVPIPPPLLHKLTDLPRSTLYPSVHMLVSGIYRLICVVSAQQNINIEDSEGLDIRVLLVSAATTSQGEGATPADSEKGDPVGAIVKLSCLARSQRSYHSILTTESEECERLLREYLINQDSRVKVQRVKGGENYSDGNGPDLSLEDDATTEAQKHLSVAVGGTWDHLHIGHKLLLAMVAFLVEKDSSKPAKLTVGITGDELLKNKKNRELLQPWSERRDAVLEFLKAIMDFRCPGDAHIKIDEIRAPGLNGHITRCTMWDDLVFDLVEISDPFGPTITDENITALVLSAETRSGGKAVNEKREAQDWSPLQIFEVDVLEAAEEKEAEDGTSELERSFESKISSTSIRMSLAEKAKTRMNA